MLCRRKKDLIQVTKTDKHFSSLDYRTEVKRIKQAAITQHKFYKVL